MTRRMGRCGICGCEGCEHQLNYLRMAPWIYGLAAAALLLMVVVMGASLLGMS